MSKNESSTKVYQTSDLGLCAGLVAKGFELVALDRSAQRVAFSFASTPILTQSITDYWSGDLLINAQGYYDALKQVKARLYGDY